MSIDTSKPLSAGWWLSRLSRKLLDRERRLSMLDAWYRGDPPLPNHMEFGKDVYQEFIRRSRSNFAELIVEAPRERMSVRGFRTAASSDDQGDDAAWAIWKENGLEIESAELTQMMLTMGAAYAIVGLDNDTNRPIITVEDPRQVITEQDPVRPQNTLAALKIFHDDVRNADTAYVYLPGAVYVATRQRRVSPSQTQQQRIGFSPMAWTWVDADFLILDDVDDLTLVAQPLPVADVVPVVPFLNKRGVGEFEYHLDLLERINHTILQRLVITVFQAFRQRAVKGVLPDTNELGEPIDYDKVFSADPGALWQLPENVEMWESAIGDLTPILGSVRADVEHLAAVTRTPMHYLTPGDASQSAEGAALSREGLVFKTQDRIARASAGWTKVMSLAFTFLKDDARADLTQLQPIWQPAERYSLAEMASASAQALTALPWETLMEQVWQLSPEELARAKTQKDDDQVFSARLAQLQAAKPQQTQTQSVTDDGGG